jgi:hypothetical protein
VRARARPPRLQQQAEIAAVRSKAADQHAELEAAFDAQKRIIIAELNRNSCAALDAKQVEYDELRRRYEADRAALYAAIDAEKARARVSAARWVCFCVCVRVSVCVRVCLCVCGFVACGGCS